MSDNRLTMDGLSELRQALQQLPEDMAMEAGDIIFAHADAAKQEIQQGYPRGRTGNLRQRVTVERNRSKVTTTAIVKSRAPHATIYEKGTARRQTDQGWNRGVMPQAPESASMIRKVVRWRRRMVDALVEYVRGKGFEVSQ